jgi:hypothetical protein
MAFFDFGGTALCIGTDFAGNRIIFKHRDHTNLQFEDEDLSHKFAFNFFLKENNMDENHVTIAKYINQIHAKSKNYIPAGRVDGRLASNDSVDRLILQKGTRLLGGNFLTQISKFNSPHTIRNMTVAMNTAVLDNLSFYDLNPEGVLYFKKNSESLFIEHNYPWCGTITREFESEELKALSNYSVERDRIWVSWGSIYELFCNLAHNLASEHKKGRIHGDLKPQNLLLLPNGLSPIDWLNYEDGQLAPFSSKGWTAPEAYMGQPISQAMDVYSMAKLFLKLLPGTDFGEVSTFKSPTGGSDSQTLEFISEPKVFLDFNGWENTVSISPDGRETLCNVLERALSLDPLSRPSMKELASVCSTSVRVRKSVDKDDSHHFIVKIRNDHDTIHWI